MTVFAFDAAQRILYFAGRELIPLHLVQFRIQRGEELDVLLRLFLKCVLLREVERGVLLIEHRQPLAQGTVITRLTLYLALRQFLRIRRLRQHFACSRRVRRVEAHALDALVCRHEAVVRCRFLGVIFRIEVKAEFNPLYPRVVTAFRLQVEIQPCAVDVRVQAIKQRAVAVLLVRAVQIRIEHAVHHLVQILTDMLIGVILVLIPIEMIVHAAVQAVQHAP